MFYWVIFLMVGDVEVEDSFRPRVEDAWENLS